MELHRLSRYRGEINVRDVGIIGSTDGSNDETTKFQAVYAAIGQRGGRVIIPPPDNGGYYAVSADIFASATSRYPVETILDARIDTTVQLIVHRDQYLYGNSRGHSPDSGVAYGGALIRAASSFPNDGTAVLRIGDSGAFTHGCRVENLTVDGAGKTAVLGITAPTIQELAGLRHVQIYNVNSGLALIRDGSFPAYNYLVEDIEVYLRASATGVGVNVAAGNARNVIRRVTVNCVSGRCAAGSIGYKLIGEGISAKDLHVENVETGIQIGENSGTRTTALLLDGVSSWDLTPGAMTSLITMPASANLDNYEIRAMHNGAQATNTINDVQMQVTLTGAQHPWVQYYKHRQVSSTYDAGAYAVVTTSAHESDTDITLGSGTTSNFDIKGAAVARLTANAGGSSIASIAGFTRNRRVRFWKAGGGTLTFLHDSGGGPGKIYCQGGSNLELAADEVMEAHYNFGPFGYWYVWKP